MTQTEKIAIGSIVMGLVVLGLKALAWQITGSVALMSDALESTVNVATALAALIAIRIAARPADTTHPYGHYKAEFFSAVLEGVIFNLYSILPAVEALIGPTRTMKATGGFARSGLWRQMMADIFNREVVVPESFESSCLGAAVLGLYALGRVDSLNIIADMVGATHRHAPIAGNVAIYSRLLPIYLSIPTKLEAEYQAIAAFQRELSVTGTTAGVASPPLTQEL